MKFPLSVRAVTVVGRPDSAGRYGWHLLVGALTVIVFVLLGLPLITVAVSALKPGQALPFDPAPLTLANIAEVFASPITYRLLATTGIYAAGSIAFGLIFAVGLGFLIERTDMPLRRSVFTSMLLTSGIPVMVIAFGWILLLSQRTGAVNVALRSLGWPGEIGPINVYSLGVMIFVTAIGITPTIFFMVGPALGRMDAVLEEAAQVSGASRFDVLRRIALPLLLPAILGATIYLAVGIIQHFEVPLAIGLPGDVTVLSTRIYLLARSDASLPNYGLSSAYGLLVLIIGIALILLHNRVLAREGRYVAVTGKAYRLSRLSLGPWRPAALAFAFGFVIVGVLLPLAVLLWTSLLPTYRPPSVEALPLVSLSNFAKLTASPTVMRAMQNTAIVGIATATITTVLAVLIAWSARRSKLRAARVLDTVIFPSVGIPSIILGLAVLVFFIRTPLYGTVSVIIIGQVAACLAYACRSVSATLIQLSPALEEAAALSGASNRQTLIRIVLPLAARGLANTWLWALLFSVRDFTFPLLLANTGTIMVASLIYEYWASGQLSLAAALGLMLAAAVLLLTPLATRIAGRSSRGATPMAARAVRV